jgi:hypothetical protein
METILHGIAAVVVKNANVERRIVSKFFQRTRITNVMMMMNLFMEHQALGVFVESYGSNFFKKKKQNAHILFITSTSENYIESISVFSFCTV